MGIDTPYHDVWIVVPAFNEASVIGDVIAELRAAFEHVVCVDDGSRDDTAAAANAAGAHVVRHPVNLGQGAAIQTGVEYARKQPGARIFATFDADGQHRVKDAVAMIDRLTTDDVDIVIASTGAPHYVVTVPRLRRFQERRKNRPLLLIDIAVPRDISPDAASIAGVTLYNIDDLEDIVHDNEAARQREAVAAKVIVDEAVEAMVERYRYLSVRPVVVSLSQQAEQTRRHFVKKARSKLPELTDDQFRVVENLSHILVRKLLRAPLQRTVEAAHTPDEAQVVRELQNVFKLDIKE